MTYSYSFDIFLQWMPVAEYAAQPFIEKHEIFSLISKICLAKSDSDYSGFSPWATTTSSGKTSYLYFNHQYLQNIETYGNQHSNCWFTVQNFWLTSRNSLYYLNVQKLSIHKRRKDLKSQLSLMFIRVIYLSYLYLYSYAYVTYERMPNTFSSTVVFTPNTYLDLAL